MARGTLIVFTNPVANEREAEFNDWYNNIHAREVTSLPGFSAIRRLRVGSNVKGSLSHRYLAIYECSDVHQAKASLDAHTAELNITDALSDDAVAVFFEDIYSFSAGDATPKER
jgi:hypothetical protein